MLAFRLLASILLASRLRPAVLLVALSAAGLPAASPHAMAQGIVAVVNGEAITGTDIDQRTRLIKLSTHKVAARKDVLEELIDEKLKIRESKKFGLDMSSSDIDSAFANMATRLRMSPDQLVKVLAGNGIQPQTLKDQIRGQTVWAQLIRGRFQQSLLVGERDILSAIESKGNGQDAAANTNSYEYTLRPIVLIVPRGSSPSAIESRRREAEALRGRVQGCNEVVDLFRTMRDAAVRDPVVKTSADLSVALRDILDKTEIGKLTPPEVTKQGVEMVALCERKATAFDTPQKREARERLFAQKFETQAKKYLQEIRRGAMIEYR